MIKDEFRIFVHYCGLCWVYWNSIGMPFSLISHFCDLQGPKLLAVFCSSFKEVGETVEAGEMGTRNASAQVFTAILDSLADCVSCCGSSVQVSMLLRLSSAVQILPFMLIYIIRGIVASGLSKVKKDINGGSR